MELLRHRRDNRKKNATRWSRRLTSVAGALGVGGFALGLFWWGGQVQWFARSASGVFFESAYFSVREIQVRGGEKVGGSEIVAMAGLKHGMNIWRIEPAAIERKVAKHPWVRRVLVRREFPRRVVIEVEERTPKAIVALGKLYYVDADGVVFKEVGSGENVSFPMLTGLRREEIASSDLVVRRRIQDAIRLSALMTKDSRTLSEIHFDAPDRLVVYTIAHPVALHMGWGDWEGKMRRLDRVLALWKGKEDRLVSLDVSFRDQVVARLRRLPR